jgi:hypothetical protein
MIGFFDPTWQPGSPPYVGWFAQLQDYYKRVLQYTDPTNPQFGKVEPPHTIGLLAWADGINWNPGGGGSEGYYRWAIGGWVYVG